MHRHFQHQAALASWNEYRLLVLIRLMDACGGFRKFGCVVLRQYVELVCGVTATAARERVRVALALVELPVIEAALAAGELSYSKARAITRAATPETEVEWLAAARQHTAEQIEYMVARTRKGEPLQRSLGTRALNKHTTRMTVILPAEEMEVVMRAVEAVRKAAGGKISSSEALVYMAADCLAGEVKPASTAERFTVVIHAGKDGSSWLETEAGNAPIRREVMERLLCDCTVRMAREDAEGLLALSRKQRTIPLVTRRAVEIRDGFSCRCPGCKNHTWVDLHHVEPRHRGGRHTRRNLILLCTQHHRMVHEGELIIEETEDGELIFRTPGGWVMGEGGGMSWDPAWAWARGRFEAVEVEEREARREMEEACRGGASAEAAAGGSRSVAEEADSPLDSAALQRTRVGSG